MQQFQPTYPKTPAIPRGTDGAFVIPVVDGAGQPVVIDAGAILRCQLKLDGGPGVALQLVETLAVVVHNAERTEVQVSWTSAQSADWPISGGITRLIFDIEINEAGQITQTAPIELVVAQEVTA